MSDKMSDQLGKLVVHVRGDSDSDLDALFSVLKNDPSAQQQNSFKHRKLPASFFKPPEPRPGLNHSREGSQDSTNAGYSVASHRPAAHGPAGLAISHGRSLSSPAQLPHTLSAVPPAPIHVKQQSLAGEFSDELGHLPQSWELNKAAGSGADQRYFLK
ncbi:hypothetical protein NP493_32g02003 [Ridgeia piscesae]|uniref:Uncharacterized protein n=1 Tax=Ridgeia piscesae TaxID=27915 RepID=A0AAD9PCL8_RIDPI|nr:hypothetical protein NP493_32g02003 [Ridgeia piscesae]